MDSGGVQRSTIVSLLVLGVLLIGAGAIIYRHIDRSNRLEYANQRRFLSSAMLNCRRDFAGELLGLTRLFEPPIWTQSTDGLKLQLVDRYQLLVEDGGGSQLLDQLLLLIYSAAGPETLYCLQNKEGLFVEQEIPRGILDLPTPALPRHLPRPGRTSSRLDLLDGAIYLTIPHGSDPRGYRRWRPGSVPGFAPPLAPESQSFRSGSDGLDSNAAEPRVFLILLRLNHDYLERELLPRFQETYFRKPLVPGFDLGLVSDLGESVLSQSVGVAEAAYLHQADASLPLVGPQGRLFPFRFSVASRIAGDPGSRKMGRLNLVAKHRSGSLQAAIGQRRAYDLLEAFGILFLLAGAAVTLLVSVQKTRSLARKQMDFVAGISHELRNPLTAIQSAGFNLSKGTIHGGDRIKEYGQLICRESRRLSHMVEQVLSYSAGQRSAESYDLQIVQLEELLESILQEYSKSLEEEDWEVEIQVDEDLPPLSVDPKAFRSCISNLVDNALKYAADSKFLSVKISHRETSGKNWIDVAVRDKGPGIPDSELSQIFQPFRRGTGHVASAKPGTGLGLALVKRHVEAHGGRIHVDSKEGVGTAFLLSFPSLKIQ
jgi:signal transduction histidine kinase